jgi:hypothetical protein
MDLLEKTESYIEFTLGVHTQLEPAKLSGLPQFLQQDYSYYQGKVLGQSCLFMVPAYPDLESPGVVEKHCQQVRKHWLQGEVVYLAETISSHNRQRLIQQKVSFIVPKTQLHLPVLGLSLREYFQGLRDKTKTTEHLSPTAQLVVLWALVKEPVREVSSAKMAERLGCSRMAAGRAYDELAGFTWATVEKAGGEKKSLTLQQQDLALWQAVERQFQSPVRKRRWMMPAAGTALPGVVAGESALAQLTMLSEPVYSVRAIKDDEYKGLVKALGLKQIKHPEPGCFQLETWAYSPELFAQNRCVDPLSLYLSLEKESDPRISLAANDLLDKFPW